MASCKDGFTFISQKMREYALGIAISDIMFTSNAMFKYRHVMTTVEHDPSFFNSFYIHRAKNVQNDSNF